MYTFALLYIYLYSYILLRLHNSHEVND